MSPFAATPAMNVSSNVKIHPFALSPTMPPLATASGRTASAAIGQIVAMNTATSMSRRKCRVDTTNPTSSSIATNPNTLPWRDASPAAGALNSTSATPPNARTANTSARGIVELAEEPGADRDDEERRERSDQGGVGDAVVRRPREEDRQVQSEEHARHQRLANVRSGDPPSGASGGTR